MKGKIISLAVAFAFGVAAIAFSVRPAGVPSGKGSGKNASISKPEELVDIITSLPSASEYYAMAMESAQKKDAKSVAAAADSVKNGIRSVSVFDRYIGGTENYTYYTYSVPGAHSEQSIYSKTNDTEVNRDQELVAYFTAEAVYYNVTANVCTTDSVEMRYYADYNGYKAGDKEKTVNVVSYEIKAEFYLGVNGAFLKFNQYDLTNKTVKYKNDKEVKNDKEEDGDSAEKVALDAIRKNYGKWIDALYFLDADVDGLTDGNADKNALIDGMVKYTCAELSSELVRVLMNATDTNCQTLKKIAGIAALAEDKSNDYYDKTDDIYAMTPFGRYTMLSKFGYKPSSSSNYDYKNDYTITQTSFVLDLTDGTKPAWYLGYDFGTDNSAGGTSSRFYDSAQEELYITNIDNTVVPNVRSSKSLYDFIGKQLREYFIKHAEDK